MSLMRQVTIGCFLFYDAPTLPSGVFDDFLTIQSAQGNISTMSYSDYILSVNSLGANISTRSVCVTLLDGIGD